MSETVPGTFQHSMQVANLAAEAAIRVGAKSQLVRTGALYHDIGKMENPAFFTENQSGGVNPHKNLSYEQSAQVVISHVTDGLKLADKHNLPKAVKDFISTHHGRGKQNISISRGKTNIRTRSRTKNYSLIPVRTRLLKNRPS